MLVNIKINLFINPNPNCSKLKPPNGGFKMEEEVGFEPTVRSHVRRFSRPLQSTALALLQRYSIGYFLILHETKFIVKRVNKNFYLR